MHAVLAAVVAEVDPTVQPVRQSFYVFVFLAVCLVVLLLSFLRHMRRAQSNLGSAKQAPAERREGADGDAP
jgi:hypothetical protein